MHDPHYFRHSIHDVFCAVCGSLRDHKIHDVVTFLSANARQVGGNHYQTEGRQHWDMVDEFSLDYFQGQITKYLFRWRKKNGVEDLEKASHYLQKYIELAKCARSPVHADVGEPFKEAVDSNLRGYDTPR